MAISNLRLFVLNIITGWFWFEYQIIGLGSGSSGGGGSSNSSSSGDDGGNSGGCGGDGRGGRVVKSKKWYCSPSKGRREERREGPQRIFTRYPSNYLNLSIKETVEERERESVCVCVCVRERERE